MNEPLKSDFCEGLWAYNPDLVTKHIKKFHQAVNLATENSGENQW